MATPYISYGLVSPHLENPADFPKPVFIWRGSCQDTPQLIYINVGSNLRKVKNIKHLSILLSLFLFINCSKTENTVTLIPEGYTGTIRILFDQKNGNDKKYEGEKRVYEIQKNGILKTKFSPQFGYHFQEYYYVSKSGKRTEIERISDLNKSILDTIDKNKVYAYRFMFGGDAVKVDSLGNVTEKRESEIIFKIGNPLN